MLGIHIRPIVTQRFNPHLMELAIAPFLWSLMTEHGPGIPEALRSSVEQVMLDNGTNAGCRTFWPECQLLAIQPVFKAVHFLFNDVGNFAYGSDEQISAFYDWSSYLVISIGMQPCTDGFLKELPEGCFTRQYIVHAAHGLEGFTHSRILSCS